MKNRISFVLLISLLISFFNPHIIYATEYSPKINSKNMIVINAHSGEIILEENKDEKINTSSLIPIIVALTVYDRKNLDEYVLVDDIVEEDIVNKDTNKVNSSNTMKLQVGEKMKIRDLLTLVLIDNNQNAIRSLAKSISNSEEEFSKLCSVKAQDLDLVNTIITGVVNDTSSKDYTTVEDTAKAMRTLSNISPLVELCFVTNYSFSPNNIVPENRIIYNKNEQILPQSKYYFEDLLCAISDTKMVNKENINTYVGIGAKDSNKFIVALKNSKDELNIYEDSEKLLSWCFDNYVTSKLISKNSKLQEWPLRNGQILNLIASTDFFYTTPKDITTYHEVKHSINFKPEVTTGDSFKKDQLMGIAEVVVDNKVVGQVPLLSSRDVTIINEDPNLQPNKYDFVQQWLIRILILFLLLSLLYLLLKTYLKFKRSKIKQARIKRRKFEYLENLQNKKGLNEDTTTSNKDDYFDLTNLKNKLIDYNDDDK